jgi:hypothetical protein
LTGREVNAVMRILIRVTFSAAMKTCITFSPFLGE